jgi:hypothetical protein
LWSGSQQPRPRVTSLRVAAEEDLLTGAYISLNKDNPGRYHIDQGRAGVPDEIWDRLDFVAVDVELPGIRVEQVLGAIMRLETLGKEGKVTLYTSYNAWTNYVIPGNSTLVSARGIPLNNALWDKNPDFDFPTLPFGGWTPEQVFSEQWSGGTHICGQFVDRNTIVNPRLIYSAEEEDDMTPQEMLQQLLTLPVPIYPKDGEPATPQTLSQLLHYAFHGSPTEHKGLVAVELAGQLAKIVSTNREGLAEAAAALENHVHEHNQSGGAIDRTSGVFLEVLAGLLHQMEEEVKNYADAI